jgi:hypothetical protein
MALVAYEIADRSPDPSQLEQGDLMDDGSIRSRVVLEGHRNQYGKYVKGLTDYLPMTKRQITDALKAIAGDGYEMRIQLLDQFGELRFDKDGEPLFAVVGQLMRFKVPPLVRLRVVDNPAPPSVSIGTQKGTHAA